MPLARLEKNRSRTPRLPEPTAMDMLYEQLKVSWCEREARGEKRSHLMEQWLCVTEWSEH